MRTVFVMLSVLVGLMIGLSFERFYSDHVKRKVIEGVLDHNLKQLRDFQVDISSEDIDPETREHLKYCMDRSSGDIQSLHMELKNLD